MGQVTSPTAASLYLYGLQQVFNVNGAEGMRLTSTGLGIGTSSPAAKLHVYGAGAETRIESSSAAAATLSLKDTGTTNLLVIGSAGQSMYFQTGGSERMRIDSGGNVMIGQSFSSGQFTVNDTAGSGTYSQAGTFRKSSTNTTNYFQGARVVIQNTSATANTSVVLDFKPQTATITPPCGVFVQVIQQVLALACWRLVHLTMRVSQLKRCVLTPAGICWWGLQRQTAD
jgi:predicted RecA/RadA family phage recombinase